MVTHFDFLIKDTLAIKRRELKLYETSSHINELVMSATLYGPNPKVDYAKLDSTQPKITALIEYSNQTILILQPAVFLSLVDKRPDKHNHCSHLIISKAERKTLLKLITCEFGREMKDKQHDNIVEAASFFRKGLLDHRCSDEP